MAGDKTVGEQAAGGPYFLEEGVCGVLGVGEGVVLDGRFGQLGDLGAAVRVGEEGGLLVRGMVASGCSGCGSRLVCRLSVPLACPLMPATLRQLIDDLVTAMNSDDLSGFQHCVGRLAAEAQGREPDFRTAVIEELAPLLPGLGGVFAKVALLAGACVEWGGSPLPLSDALPKRAARAMEDYFFGGHGSRPNRGREAPPKELSMPAKPVLRVDGPRRPCGAGANSCQRGQRNRSGVRGSG
ncbi:hypothetical protein [Streptomyces virginiae]|uniref:hypothetical protein n=1 Tax=Streptomyces virginiae TaxID=1961 RepID=UPI00386FAB88|nr:hypothetical protein OG253_00955 [Streptomyces virginiae]